MSPGRWDSKKRLKIGNRKQHGYFASTNTSWNGRIPSMKSEVMDGPITTSDCRSFHICAPQLMKWWGWSIFIPLTSIPHTWSTRGHEWVRSYTWVKNQSRASAVTQWQSIHYRYKKGCTPSLLLGKTAVTNYDYLVTLSSKDSSNHDSFLHTTTQ
jgi:hypothetical protein